MRGRSISSSGIIDGCCTDKDIAGRFRDIYGELYTSGQDKNLPGVVQDVNKLVEDRCNVGQCTSSQCHTISLTVIKKAVRSLAHNKIDQTYNISSTHFINGTELLFSMLSQIITEMLRHGSTNVHLNKVVIKPIPKSSLKSRRFI